MKLSKIFKRREWPSTEGLAKGEERYAGDRDMIFPPVDERGRYVNDRSRAVRIGPSGAIKEQGPAGDRGPYD
ncbi:MAG: hypothetical protein LBG62_01155 [Candidatus Methanoplasma sp.]|jgi:hypothetical protein|nr:hypothetical protein [Candidatus Methanoplasma sp.]